MPLVLIFAVVTPESKEAGPKVWLPPCGPQKPSPATILFGSDEPGPPPSSCAVWSSSSQDANRIALRQKTICMLLSMFATKSVRSKSTAPRSECIFIIATGRNSRHLYAYGQNNRSQRGAGPPRACAHGNRPPRASTYSNHLQHGGAGRSQVCLH